MSTYKKVPTLCSKERRDTYKHTGKQGNVPTMSWDKDRPIFWGISKEGMIQFDLAIKADMKRKGITIKKNNN